jgi:predicted acylesterase/phospholipase RssA
MKGGGVKGLAYIGAIRELGDECSFNWYAGTSAGAITAVLLAAGYTVDELDEILRNKDFSDFLDSKPWQLPLNLLFHQGLYPADAFTIWLDQLLSKKLNSFGRVTLGQIHEKNRVTVYASRRHRDALIFDSAMPEHKNTAAAFAVRCSMSIPFIFFPQRDQGMRVFDGGTRNNYPVRILLESAPETDFIGLYLGPENYEGQDTDTSAFSDLISIWKEPIDEKSVMDHREKTIIIDPRPISTIDFRLSTNEKEFLLDVGKLSAMKFLMKRKEQKGDAELQKKLDEACENLEKRRKELTLVRHRRRRRRKFLTLAVSALLFTMIFLMPRFIPFCFMSDLSRQELSQIGATLNSSESLDSSATAAFNKLAAVPAGCSNREKVDDVLLNVLGTNAIHGGHVEIARKAFEQLKVRIQPNYADSSYVLESLTQDFAFLDENLQDDLYQSLREYWKGNPNFRKELIDLIKSTTKSRTKLELVKFLNYEAQQIDGEASSEAKKAITEIPDSRRLEDAM